MCLVMFIQCVFYLVPENKFLNKGQVLNDLKIAVII